MLFWLLIYYYLTGHRRYRIWANAKKKKENIKDSRPTLLLLVLRLDAPIICFFFFLNSAPGVLDPFLLFEQDKRFCRSPPNESSYSSHTTARQQGGESVQLQILGYTHLRGLILDDKHHSSCTFSAHSGRLSHQHSISSYRCFAYSVLTSGILGWCGSTSAADRKSLLRTITTAQNVSDHQLPSTDPDPRSSFHSANYLFALFPHRESVAGPSEQARFRNLSTPFSMEYVE